ncbi:MAG: leucine-rich repeat domain-containing protein, partial [Chlamydiia bacterium]|nr:leucine-rich repeat domain-containing protein [Chlamydiia bacterium]
MDTTVTYQMAGIEKMMMHWLDFSEKSLPSSEIAVSICLQLSRSAKIFQTTFQEIYKKDLDKLKGEETFYDQVMRGKDYQDLSMRHPRLMDPRVSKAQKIAFLLTVLNGADCESRPLEQICTLVAALPENSDWKATAPAKRYLPYVEFRKKEMENFRQWGVWYYKKIGWSDVESKIRFGESCFTYAGFRPDQPYELADGCRIPCPIISDSKVLSLSPQGRFEISVLPGHYINEKVTEVTSIESGIRSLGQLYLAFPILQILDLAGNQLQHIDSKYLPKSLTELTLSYNKIEAPVLENLPQLQRIILDGNPLRDCTGIRNLPELRLLSIKMCGLSFDSYQMIDPSIRMVTVNSDKRFGFEPPLEDRELFAKVLPYCFDRWLVHGEEVDYLGLRKISHGILSTIDQWFKEQWERLRPQLDDSVARSRLICHFDSYNKRNGESIEELIEYFAVRYFPDSSDRLQSNSTLRNQTKDQKIHMLKHAFPMFQLLLPLSSSQEVTQPELSHLNHLLWNLKDRRGLRKMKEDYDKRIVIKNTSRLPSYIVQKFPTLKMLSLSLCEMR